MKTKETLIGTVITNTGVKPSMKITNVLPADNIGHYRTSYNYVIQVDNKPEKHTVESLGLIGLPKSFEKSIREKALKWFRSFPTVDQQMLTDRYYNERHRESLTGREIEQIYHNEVIEPNLQVNQRYSKPNQKQFTQFNPKLFKSYIDKFSDEDQTQMLHLFICTYYKSLLEKTFETDTKFSLEVKSILKDLFSKIANK